MVESASVVHQFSETVQFSDISQFPETTGPFAPTPLDRRVRVAERRDKAQTEVEMIQLSFVATGAHHC